MKGVISRVLLSKGYAFVRGSDGMTRFVHVKDVWPEEAFDRMREGQAVEFEPVEVENGKGNKLKGKNVRVL